MLGLKLNHVSKRGPRELERQGICEGLWLDILILLCFQRTVSTLRPRQNGRHFADDIFKCIFLNENAWISLKISLKFVPKVLINNIPALVQIMAWRRPGDKSLSEPMMVSLLTHICVTRPQWVKAECPHHPQNSISSTLQLICIYWSGYRMHGIISTTHSDQTTHKILSTLGKI